MINTNLIKPKNGVAGNFFAYLYKQHTVKIYLYLYLSRIVLWFLNITRGNKILFQLPFVLIQIRMILTIIIIITKTPPYLFFEKERGNWSKFSN